MSSRQINPIISWIRENLCGNVKFMSSITLLEYYMKINVRESYHGLVIDYDLLTNLLSLSDSGARNRVPLGDYRIIFGCITEPMYD